MTYGCKNRALVVTKLKDGKGEGKEYRFTLPEVLIDFDSDEGIVSSLVALHGEVFEASGAREVAKTEAKDTKRDAKVTGPRPTAALEYMRAEANAGRKTFDLSALKAEIAALFTNKGLFTDRQLTDGKASNEALAALRVLERHEKVIFNGEKVEFTEGRVSPTEGGTCDF